jgi:2-phospho-L-lactate guanylyltransferase
VLRDTAEAGQSAAASIGIDHALADGFERVLLVPGDTPLLDPAEVESLLAIPRAVSIVPDRHGTGTNALVLSPPDAIAPSFGPGSLKRHMAGAEAAGVPSAVEKIPTLMLDVDTGDDLSALTAALAERRGQAPATREALHELERLRRQPVAPA